MPRIRIRGTSLAPLAGMKTNLLTQIETSLLRLLAAVAVVFAFAASTPAHAQSPNAQTITGIQNALKTLGLQPNTDVSWEQIKQQHRSMSFNFHPDRAGTSSTDRMALINEANDYLKKVGQQFPGKSIQEIQSALKAPPANSQNSSSGAAAAAASTKPQGNQNKPGVGPQRPNQLVLFEFRHPQTKEKIRVHAPDTPEAELKKYSPKNRRIDQQCRDGVSLKEELIEEIPLETTGFAIITMVQSLAMSGGDPGALKHLFEQNITDMTSHLSIVAFVLAHQSTEKFFKMTGLMFDPCRFMRSKHAKPVPGQLQLEGRVRTANRFQRIFGRLGPGFAMGIGMVASSFTQDVFKDKDWQLCAKGLIAKVDEVERLDACERAYETWTVGRKLNQYLPDAISMVSAYFISAYAAMPVVMGTGKVIGQVVKAGAERFIPLFWRGLVVTWNASVFAAPPTVKLAVQILNFAVMVPIQTFLMPPMKNFWTTWTHGEDIREAMDRIRSEIDRARKNGWKWAPEKKTCNVPNMNAVDMMGNATGIDASTEVDCTDNITDIPKLVKKYGERQEKWRRFLLQTPLESQQNWKDYVLQFQNTYTAAYNFSNWFVGEVVYQNVADRNKSGARSKLFLQQPLKGIHLTQVKEDGTFEKGGEETAAIAIQKALIFIKDYLANANNRVRPDDRANLRRILLGLALADEKFPIPALENPKSSLSQMFQTVAPELREGVLYQIRMSEVERALRILNEVLERDIVWRANNVPFPSPLYEKMAASNPYMRLRMILGDPRPAPAGMEALREFDSDDTMIVQDLKQNHPGGIGSRATTPSMTDYLLGMAVCGPDADPSLALKLKEQRRREASWLEWTWQNITGKAIDEAKNVSANQMIELEKITEDAKAPGASWFNPNRNLTLVRETWLFRAAFHPPRLTKDLGIDFCRTRPTKGTNPDLPGYLIHDGEWLFNGSSYKGFLEIAKRNLRPEIIGDGTENKFEPWWTEKVDPSVTKVVDTFLMNFKNVLEDEFYPAITGDGERYWRKFVADYKKFGETPGQSTWSMISNLRSVLSEAGINLGNDMSEKHENLRLKLGAIPSILHEAEYYLSLVEEVHLAKFDAGKSAAEKAKIERSRKETRAMLLLMTNLFNKPEKALRAITLAEELFKIEGKPDPKTLSGNDLRVRLEDTFKVVKEKYKDSLKRLAHFTLGKPEIPQQPKNSHLPKPALSPEETKAAIIGAAIAGLDRLTAEGDVYLGMMKTVYVSGLYDRSAAKDAALTEELLNEGLAQ